MFFPTSPRPPNGMMRKLIGGVYVRSNCSGLEQPEAREAVSDALALLVGRLDERQPVAADVVAEQVQRRLDRDRIAGDAKQLDRRRELAVERPRGFVLAGLPEPYELLHLRPHDVGVDADAADAAELEERQDQVVVAGVEIEAEGDDPARLLEIRVRLL